MRRALAAFLTMLVFSAAGGDAAAAAADAPAVKPQPQPDPAALNVLDSLPVNQWNKVSELRTKSKAFCATVYMPATDEFLLWGLPHERFEVETFSVKTGKWRNAKPAEGLPEFPGRWRDSISIHGQGYINGYLSILGR